MINKNFKNELILKKNILFPFLLKYTFTNIANLKTLELEYLKAIQAIWYQKNKKSNITLFLSVSVKHNLEQFQYYLITKNKLTLEILKTLAGYLIGLAQAIV